MKFVLHLVLLLSLLINSGCSVFRGEDIVVNQRKIIFITDRKDSSVNRDSSNLYYGTCTITIPQNREIGSDDSKSSATYVSSDTLKKKLIKKINKLNTSDVKQEIYKDSLELFYAQLLSKAAFSDTSKVLIFIPGYNHTFQSAAERTAQLVEDLEFKGVAFFITGTLVEIGRSILGMLP